MCTIGDVIEQSCSPRVVAGPARKLAPSGPCRHNGPQAPVVGCGPLPVALARTGHLIEHLPPWTRLP